MFEHKIAGNYTLKYVLYRIVLAFYGLLDLGRMHPLRERSIRALARSVDYIDRQMPNAMGFGTQRELMKYALSEIRVAGHHMEFGVFMGGSIRFLAKRKPNETFHGFDSFEGMPGPWLGFNVAKSELDLKGNLPKVPANVKLYKGWFSDTLPAWLAANPGPVAFINVDCDIYSSTADVFTALESRFVPGTVLVFDEYFNYPNWEQHEHRAWQECVKRCGIVYEYLGYARVQTAVRILSIGGKTAA